MSCRRVVVWFPTTWGDRADLRHVVFVALCDLFFVLPCVAEPRKNAGIVNAEFARYGMSGIQGDWARHVKAGICTMSPTLGRWILERSGKDFKAGASKNSLSIREIVKTLFSSGEQPTLSHDAGESALLLHRVILQAQGSAM